MRRALETASLFALTAVVVLRPLVTESYDSAGSSLTHALSLVSDPSPVRTLVFDLVILLAVCGWLLARATGPTFRYRPIGLEWGAVLIAVAAVGSSITAGNQRLAIDASIDWLCLPILTMVLVQLLRRSFHRRIFLAAVLASAIVQTVQCVDQYFVGYEETWNQYQTIKDEFWARQGVSLDSSKVTLFEQRLRAREAQGFLPHSNVTGAYLALCGLAAAGIAVTRWRQRQVCCGVWYAVVTTLLAMAILTAVLLTKSLGALFSVAAAGVAAVVLYLFRSWFARHRRRAILLGWAGFTIGALAVVGHGLHHNSFPHMSMTFRWQYWRASAQLIADHPFTGVGRENFGRHYLRYKDIQSPEEVANPHDLFVQAASDWGVLGLMGLIVMLIGGSIALTKRLTLAPPLEPQALPARAAPPTTTHPNGFLWWTCGLLLVVTLVRLPLLDADDPSFQFYATITTGVFWLVGFLLIWVCGMAYDDPQTTPSPTIRTAVALGLFAFLLHDTINFAFFVPAAATTFFALLAFCIADRTTSQTTPTMLSPPRRWVPFTAGAMVTTAFVVGVLIPVSRASRARKLAWQVARQPARVPLSAQPADRYFRLACAADPLDPTSPAERSQWLISLADSLVPHEQAFAEAAQSLARAIQRDPSSIALRRKRIQLFRTWAANSGRAGHYLATVDAAKEALKIYPLNPAGLALLARTEAEAGEATNSRKLLRRAVEDYRGALELDDARLSWETLRRFSPGRRQAIQSEIDRWKKRITARQ